MQTLQHDLTKIMRGFGRQCRGQGKVFVSLVRQTETHLLTTGDPVVTLAQTAQAQVQSAAELTQAQRAQWDTTVTLALVTPQQLVTPSRRLTHGKPLTRCKLVNAYAPTRFCRKVDSNTLLSTISGIFRAQTFQYMV